MSERDLIGCSVDLRRLELPMSPALRTSHGTWVAREAVLVRVKTVSGVHYGEAGVVPGFGGATIEDLVEAARLWRGRPVWRPGEGLESYPEEWQFCIWTALNWGSELPSQLPTACLRPLGEVVDGGGGRYPGVVKVKIGLGQMVLEREEVLRGLERLEEGRRLRLDANGGLGEEWLGNLGEILNHPRLEYLEQPFPPQSNLYEHRMVQAYSGKIALDESVRTYSEGATVLESGWNGWMVCKPSLAGWPDDAILGHPRSVISSAFETPVGWLGVALLAARNPKNLPGLDTLSRFGEPFGSQESNGVIPLEGLRDRAPVLWELGVPL
ncbi:MAG: enolase C-terminal domain-like protein [Puniceicoccaceae bacterium]